MPPRPLARSLACVALGGASFGAAGVALRSAGEPGRQLVAAPLLALFGLVWLAGAAGPAVFRPITPAAPGLGHLGVSPDRKWRGAQ